MDKTTKDSLRPLLRQLIYQVVTEYRGGEKVIEATIRSSDDLQDFAKMLASKMSQDEEFLKNIQNEKVQFKLTDPSSTHKTTGSIKADTASILTPEHRPYVKESGVVTERLVTQLVQDDRPLIIHPKVVVTPLAKEMIRSKRLLLEVLE